MKNKTQIILFSIFGIIVGTYEVLFPKRRGVTFYILLASVCTGTFLGIIARLGTLK